MSRDQVIAAIYETVIQPGLYDVFMDAWNEHIQAVLNDPQSANQGADGPQDGQDGLLLDPELQAHFTRAYEILEQIGRKAPQSCVLEQVSQSPGFSLVARPDGVILAIGTAAAAMLSESPKIEALKDHLTANSVQLLTGLQKIAQGNPQSDASVVLSIGAHPRHLIARITRTKDAKGQSSPLIVIDALDYRWSEQAAQMLVISFGLSPAEVEIVRNLLAGHTLREIAQTSDRSEHTVRNQAKAVLTKTGAPSQVDLIRLVAFLINADTKKPPTTDQSGALPFEMIDMSSGLEMQVFSAGAKTGQPVIFLHGMLDGMAPLQFLHQDMRRHGLRVLAPVRPGYGLSNPVSDATQSMRVFVEHVRELILRQKLERPIIIGNLAGAIYGHILCAQSSDLVAGQVAIASSGPVTRISQLSNMARRQRLVAYTARFAPALLPFVLRAGIAQIDGKDIAGFMEALFPTGCHDHAVIKALDLATTVQAGYRFSVQQGHLGFTCDSHHVVRDWSSQLSTPTAPVIHLHGVLDQVVSVANIAPFAQARDNVSLRLLPDAGQTLMFEHPDVVYDAIQELLEGDKA